MARDSQAPPGTRPQHSTRRLNRCCCGACSYCDHCRSFRPPPPPHVSNDPCLLSLHYYQQQQHLSHQQMLNPFLQQQQQLSHIALTSLLQRISTLEITFHNLSSYAFSRPFKNHPLHSLRDTAARVIQTRFRSFLAHRSRILRQLSHLARITVVLTSLKSHVSIRTHFDAQAVSQKAMDLLLQIDSVPGDSTIIKEGKRSISKDLMEFIDGFHMKKDSITSEDANIHKSAMEFRCHVDGGNQWQIMENLNERIDRISGLFSDFQTNDSDQKMNREGTVHETFHRTNQGTFHFINKLMEERFLIEKRVHETFHESDSGDDYRDAVDDHYNELEDRNVAATWGVANSKKTEIVQHQT